jgi:lycopene cyclase domain-containing protein
MWFVNNIVSVMEYLLVQLAFLVIGMFLVWKYRLVLFESVWQEWVVLGTAFLTIVAWDSVAVFFGWWAFGENGLIGVTIGLLPVEEYSLAIILPWFLIVFYRFAKKLIADEFF